MALEINYVKKEADEIYVKEEPIEYETPEEISIKLEPEETDQDVKETGACVKIEIEMGKSVEGAEGIYSEATTCVKEERVEVFIKEEKLDSGSIYADHRVKEEPVAGPVLLPQVPVPVSLETTALDMGPLQVSDSQQPAQHYAHTTTSNRYHCNNCDQIYSDEPDLINHICQVSESSTLPDKNQTFEPNPAHKFKCGHCNYTSTHRYRVQRHEIIHTDVRPFQCSICDYRGKRYSDVREHQKTHSEEKAFKCDLCDYQCIRKSDLRLHQRIHTGEKPYKCDTCDYRCTSKSSLRIHQTQHKEKSFKCTQCNYKSTNIVYLRNHLTTHSNDKRFECSQCGEKFANKPRLRCHLMTHVEKPYSCNQCNYKCNTKATLDIHLKTHTGDKPYKCDRCEYKCIRKATLQRHQVTHMDVKPFRCRHCDFASGHVDALRRHLKNIHSEHSSLKNLINEIK